MDFQTKQAIDVLAGQLADMQETLRRVERGAVTPQLPNSSLTGGAIKAIDEDGTHRGSIGFQGDGTFGTVAQNGPPPPAPSAPIVTPGQLSLTITWDGLFATGDDGDPATQPLDFDHVQVHVSAAAGFTPDDTTLHGSLAKPGALVVTPLLDGATYHSVLVGVNTSGVSGPSSADVSGVPDAVVASDILDGIVTTLKLADDAVTNAKIANTAVDANKLADGSVSAQKIIDAAITAGKVAFTARDIGAITTSFTGSAPSAPAVGDVWFDSSDSNKMKRWDGTAWTGVADARIATAVTNAATAITAAAAAQSAADAARATADGAIRTYYQSTPPTGENSTTDVGDLWFDTDTNQAYRWSGTAWVLIEDNSIAAALAAAQSAQTTADGKIVSYFQGTAPTGAATGDLWYDTAHDNRVTWWNGSTWQPVQMGNAAIAAGAIDTSKVTFTARDLSGINTTISGSAPASPVTGDLWIDSANGNLVKRWSGSAWIAATVGTSAIQASAITSSLIAANTIVAANISAGAIGTTELAANAVTAAKIQAGTITATQIATDTITAGNIAAGAVSTSELAAGAVTAAKITAGTITATEIGTDVIVAGNIAAGAIGASELAANSVIAGKIAAGVVDATAIAAGAVTTAKLNALAVTSDKIAANTITAGQIAAGAITASQIAANTITSAQIAAGAITAATIAAGAIDGKTITGATVVTNSATGGVFVYSSTPAAGNLIVSIAAQAGTDAYGNTYPQGISSTAGDIGGTLNVSSAGIYFYVPNAGTGNLRTSIANADGTDRYGNSYKAGLYVNQRQGWFTGNNSHTVAINPTGQSGPEVLFLPSGTLGFVHLLGDLANNRFLIENTGLSSAFLELNLPVKATGGYVGSCTFQGAEVTYPVSSGAFTDYSSVQWLPPSIVCPPSETIELDIWFDGHPSTGGASQTITLAARIKQGSTVLYAPVGTGSGAEYSNDGVNATTNDMRVVGRYIVGKDILGGRAGQTITFVPTVRITSTATPTPHILRACMSVKPSLYSQATSSFI